MLQLHAVLLLIVQFCCNKGIPRPPVIGAVPYLLLRSLVRLLVLLQLEQKRDTAADEKWIEQPIDHFDPLLQAEGRRWRQRYFEMVVTQRRQYQHHEEQQSKRQEEGQSVSPMFVYIGGEAEISPKDITSGLQLLLNVASAVAAAAAAAASIA